MPHSAAQKRYEARIVDLRYRRLIGGEWTPWQSLREAKRERTVDWPWEMTGTPGVSQVEWEEVPTGIPAAKISRTTWQADQEWNQKNPEGRRKAIWYPKAGRVELYRLSGPALLEHKGEEVDYPATDEDPTTWTIHTDPGPAVTVKLEWVE